MLCSVIVCCAKKVKILLIYLHICEHTCISVAHCQYKIPMFSANLHLWVTTVTWFSKVSMSVRQVCTETQHLTSARGLRILSLQKKSLCRLLKWEIIAASKAFISSPWIKMVNTNFAALDLSLFNSFNITLLNKQGKITF